MTSQWLHILSLCVILFHELGSPVVYSGSSDSERHLVPAFNCNISKFSLLNMLFAIGFGIHSLLGQESSALIITCLIFLSE